jgi:hypothetical protein
MPRLNVGELIDDPDFNQDFTITRRSGSWDNARFEVVETTINTYGIIDPHSTSELELDANGSLIQGRLTVYTHTPMYVTILNPSGQSGYISDEITWQGNQYTVISDENYSDYGYYAYTCQLKDAAGDPNT